MRRPGVTDVVHGAPVGPAYFPCSPEQSLEVEARIRNEHGDLVWRPGRLQGWSLRGETWRAHVLCTPNAEVAYVVVLPADRLRGAVPPVG